MKKLKNNVKELVEEEYIRASEKFGAKHNSMHEAYAVILEEIEEAKLEVGLVDEFIKKYWEATKHNAPQMGKNKIQNLYEYALNAACKYIQVAAMAHKALQGYVVDELPSLDDIGLTD